MHDPMIIHYCEECGKVYNPRLGDRFWDGPFETDDGERFELLCDGCRRTHIGTRDDAIAAKA